MSLVDLLIQHQRLCVLRLLAAAGGWRLNDSVLRGGLAEFGLAATRDQLTTMLAWLEEQGLLFLIRPRDDVTVAVLTHRGLDVAEGNAVQPGVRRPSPSDVGHAALRAAIGLGPDA